MNYSKLSNESAAEAVYLEHATGEMRFKFTNDYMFRAVLQESTNALKGLVCAVLGIEWDQIVEIDVLNPIELGKSIGLKDFVLDTRVLLNNNMSINLEMQVVNQGNWPERSLAYMCRSFDSLNSGQDYIEAKPVIQVCFMDFTLFQENPEFFSTYMFMNVKNYIVYSDKLKLMMVDLTQIENATEEDHRKGIDHWARLFKATTWEEVKMLSNNNDYLQEAAKTAYKLSTDEVIRMQCQAREDFYRQQRYIQHRLEKAEKIEQKYDIMELEIQRMEEEYQQLEEEYQRMEEEHQRMEEEHQRMEEEHQRMEEEHQRMEEEHQRMEEEHQRMEEEHQRMEEEHQQVEKVNQYLNEENQNLNKEILRLKAKLEELMVSNNI